MQFRIAHATGFLSNHGSQQARDDSARSAQPAWKPEQIVGGGLAGWISVRRISTC